VGIILKLLMKKS